MTEIILKVKEAEDRDIGRCIVRINPSSMAKLNVKTGDILRIKGMRNTGAIAWPAYQEDVDHEIIRMDERIRKNSGVGLSEEVAVSKVQAPPAKTLTLAQTSVPIELEPRFVDFVRRKLLSCPVKREDTLFIPTLTRAIPLSVISTEPEGIVVVGKSTSIIL